MIVHARVSVRGYLRRPVSSLRGMFAREDGSPCTGHEAREALMDHLARGHEYIPVGEPCEGWSWETGCPGHESPEEATP